MKNKLNYNASNASASGKIFTGLALGISFALLLILPSAMVVKMDDSPGFHPVGLKGSTPSVPISIDGNGNLAGFVNNTGGSGTSWADAVIIENLEIAAVGAGNCIEISNTDIYLIIRNCTLTGATLIPTQVGLYLDNCTNVNITGNSISGNNNGIDATSLYNSTVTGNIASGNTYSAIELTTSSNNTVSGNDVSDNFLIAFTITLSNNNTFSKNIIINNFGTGITFDGSNNSKISGNIVVGNVGGISLVFSSNNIISGNNLSGNVFEGLHLSNSDENTVVLNMFYDNLNYGIVFLTDSTGNKMFENWLWNNSVGDIYESGVGDGMAKYSFNWFVDPALHDVDRDGLSDADEFDLGTDPLMVDSDNDNLLDSFEVKYGTDPLDDDSDDDGYYDGIEVAGGTDPMDNGDYPGRNMPVDNGPIIMGIAIASITGAAIVIVSFLVVKQKRMPRK